MGICNEQKSKYLHILEQLKAKCAKDFTQKEFAEMLNVSLRTFGKFWRGQIIDMNMLIAFANFLSVEILFWIKDEF